MDTQSSSTFQSQSSHSGSESKTGSSKSFATVAEREEDFTKDNAASPVDLECQIQAERITKIIDEMIYKVKMSLCLPALMKSKVLISIITGAHYEDLTFIYDQYENPLFSTSLQNIAAVDDLRAGDMSMKNRLNPELGHLIYILNSYPALKHMVEDMVEEMKSSYISYKSNPPQPGVELLLAMEHFRELMFKQMTQTAVEVLAAKLHTRKKEEANAKLLGEIDEISAQLKEDKDKFEEQMKVKTALIEKLENELAMLYTGANAKLKKQMLDSF